MDIVNATKAEAADLAYLINIAGEGIPEYLWSGMTKESETALEVGAFRASRDEGGFSYKNAKVIRLQNQIAGMIIAYQLDDPYETGNLEECPEVVRPLIELEAMTPGSWYINALATYEKFRGLGIATHLIQNAERQAVEHNVHTMSIIVASENTAAKQLYLKSGYEILAQLPVVDYPGALHSGRWELLTKDLG